MGILEKYYIMNFQMQKYFFPRKVTSCLLRAFLYFLIITSCYIIFVLHEGKMNLFF